MAARKTTGSFFLCNSSYLKKFLEENKMKKIIAMLLAVMMLFAIAACGNGDAGKADSATYTIGICQLVQHPALDAATQGFKDAVIAELGEDNVVFDEQNASGDSATCATICNGFASSQVDLIMANATPALQAAVAATDTIPILGTSVTEYGVALGIDNFDGTVGTNVSGTSDLAPLDQQAEMITELCPDAKNVGIIYCSAEANSIYQAQVVKECLEAKNINVTVYTFADSNDVSQVTKGACESNDVLYIPTDNTAASCTDAINAVAEPAGVPIIAGEEGICSGCGIATLSIDYYELGVTTGKMAVKILTGEANVADMAIEYYANPVKKYNADLASALNIDIPEGYEAIA